MLGTDNGARLVFVDLETAGLSVWRPIIQIAAVAVTSSLEEVETFEAKIAFDERFSKYSPGVLLELFNMRNFVDNGTGASSMDSCAVTDHSMINRLWTGRRTMTTCLMACRGPGLVLLNHWTRLRQLNRWISKRHVREGEDALRH